MNPPETLTAKSLRALKWNYLGTVARVVLQFGSQIALARLVGPDATGVFAYAFLTVGLCALVVEMGLGAALVQVPELSDQALATACGRLLWAGALAAVALFASADALAEHVLSAPRAAPVLRAMAPSLLIAAAMFPAAAILKRQIEFKVIQISELVSYIVGYVLVGITAAWYGWGEWSLVLAWYTQTGLACLFLYLKAPRSLAPGNPLRALSLAGFGLVVMFTNMLNWTIEYGTHLLIGRFFGAASLGQFTIANNLVRTPANHLVTNLQAVLFPIAARSQANDAGLRRAYLTVLGGVALVAFPVFGYFAAMASPIVVVLLGPKWLGAAAVLTPLALAMIPHVAMALCGPILAGRGNPHIELRAQLATATMLLAAMLIASSLSLPAMAWALAAVYLARYVWMTASLVKLLRVPISGLWQALCGPALLGLISASCAVGTVAVLHGLPAGTASPILELTVSACAATALIAATIWLAPAWVFGPFLRQLVRELVATRPAIAGIPAFQHLFGAAARSTP
jgi:O-antigen/teichoic acid export membrane protein